MKILGQILSLILCFQLAGCNSAAPKGGDLIAPRGAPSTSDTVELSGSIASALQVMDSLLWPRAHAAEGTLHIYDVSNPAAPVELHTEEISGGAAFRVTLKRAAVRAKLLKAVFSSSEGDDKSRESLFDLQGTEARVDASMDTTTSLRSKIFLAQIIAEDAPDARDRFREIKADSIEDELALLGNAELVEKLLLGSEMASSVLELMAKHRIAAATGDSFASEELQRELFSMAVQSGVVTDEAVLNCDGTESALYFKDRSFRVSLVPIDKEVVEKFSGSTELGDVSTSDEATKMLKSMAATITELSKAFEKNLSVRIYFEELERANKPLLSCRLFGLEPSEADLAAQAELETKELFDRSILDSLSVGDVRDSDEALKRLADLYKKTLQQLDDSTKELYLDPLVVEKARESVARLFEARFREFYLQLNPSKFTATDDLDLSSFDAVDLRSVASVREGSVLLEKALDKTLTYLKETLAPEELEARVAEQLQWLKYLKLMRLLELETTLERRSRT